MISDSNPNKNPQLHLPARCGFFYKKAKIAGQGGGAAAEGVKSRLGGDPDVLTAVVTSDCWVITALARSLVWVMTPAAITMAARTTTAAIPTHSMVTRPSSFFTYLTRLFTKLFIVQFPFICFSLDTHGIIHSQILRILQWII